MTYLSKKSIKKGVLSESVFRRSMKNRSTLNAFIKFYEHLLSKNIILPNGGAYKRLVQLKERYVSTY